MGQACAPAAPVPRASSSARDGHADEDVAGLKEAETFEEQDVAGPKAKTAEDVAGPKAETDEEQDVAGPKAKIDEGVAGPKASFAYVLPPPPRAPQPPARRMPPPPHPAVKRPQPGQPTLSGWNPPPPNSLL